MSKQCSLLQILVAATLHSVSEGVKRYPDPFDCHKYYMRLTDTSFPHISCPIGHWFNQLTEGCQKDKPTHRLIASDTAPCSGGFLLEYCCTSTTFTYCTPDGIKIVDNGTCPSYPCNCPAVITC
jgi:hypothetical protein